VAAATTEGISLRELMDNAQGEEIEEFILAPDGGGVHR
jgi:hypothetical protein